MSPLILLPLLFIMGALAWFLSTVVAGGAASLVLPLLVLLVGTQQAAPSIAIAAILANPTRAFVFASYIDWQVIRYMLPGTCIGAVIGAYGFTQMDPQYLKFFIGIFLVSTIFQGRLENSGIKLMPHVGWFFFLGMGVAFISGIVGAIGPVYNPFLVSHGLIKEHLIATKAFNSFITQAVKIIAYGSFGALNSDIILYGCLIGSGAILGVIAARKYLVSMDIQRFRKIMYIFMPAIGVLFICQSLGIF